MKISSLASLEGYYRKWPRMDDELLEQYHEGIIATTGCPSGAVQTRLRLGQYDEALKAAGKYQDIFGKENYFLELMDHGIPIETAVRDDLLRIAKHLGIPLAGDQRLPLRHRGPGGRARRAALRRHQLPGRRPDPVPVLRRGYYLRTADEMRALNSSDEWARGVPQHAADRRAGRVLQGGLRPPRPGRQVPRPRRGDRDDLAPQGGAARRGPPVRRRGARRTSPSGSSSSSASSSRWGSPATSWSSPTSASTRGTTRSRSAPAAGRRPAAWSPTSPGSPSSTRSSTACCSSGSSTPSASACPTSTWTSTSAAAAT